jgi:hypothetical protein
MFSPDMVSPTGWLRALPIISQSKLIRLKRFDSYISCRRHPIHRPRHTLYTAEDARAKVKVQLRATYTQLNVVELWQHIDQIVSQLCAFGKIYP